MFVKNIGNDYIASVKNDQFLCAPEDVEQMPVEGLLLQVERDRMVPQNMTLRQPDKWTEFCVLQ
jgi:hypothetical protein